MPLVVHLTEKALAGWPLRLCQGLTKHTRWRARCVVQRHRFRSGVSFPADLVIGRDDSEIARLLARADLVAFHGEHTSTTFPGGWRGITQPKRKVVHFHTGPAKWTRDWVRAERISCIVSAWYHAEHADPGWLMLPHFVDTDAIRPIERPPLQGRKLRVAWTPSTTADKIGHPSNKGHAQTSAILRNLSEVIEPVIATGLPVEQCLALRASCDVGLDELVSGSIHQTTIENMALGLVPIFHASPAQIERVRSFFGKITLPCFAEARGGTSGLEAAIHRVARSPSVKDSRANARMLAERYWSARVLAPRYAEAYDAVLSDRRAFASDCTRPESLGTRPE